MEEKKKTKKKKTVAYASDPHPDDFRHVPAESQRVTRERIMSFLPKGTAAKVTDDMVDMINNLENDTGLPQNLMEEDVMSYLHLVGSIKGVNVLDLINAVKYCNLKRNMTNNMAWSIVFPAKMEELLSGKRDASSFVSMYNQSKLVVAIDKMMIIPTHIMYQGYFHQAVKKQFELMNGISAGDGRVSPMVEHLAAKELALLTKQPEEAKSTVDVNINHGTIGDDYKAAIAAMAKAKMANIEEGEDLFDTINAPVRAKDEAIEAKISEDV